MKSINLARLYEAVHRVDLETHLNYMVAIYECTGGKYYPLLIYKVTDEMKHDHFYSRSLKIDRPTYFTVVDATLAGIEAAYKELSE
jgi:hypothetical protein|tara:strand:- start:2601 stop:2858 length:258 start_codon:yes stop_codon:yes gene_type:complete